jgi:hypothetical protein
MGERNEQGTGWRAHPGFHARAIGTDVHAASRMARRRCDQGGEGGGGRYHARPASRHSGCRQPLLHDAQPQQALDHRRREASEGQGDSRGAGQALRRPRRKFRAGCARPDGSHVGSHQRAQSADDRRIGQGVRSRAVRGLQGVRERRAVRGGLRVDDRFRRWSAARHRRADRRFGYRASSRARHRRRALPAQHDGSRSESSCCDAGRRAQSLSREASRSAAARAHRRDGRVPAVSERQVRRSGAAGRECIGGRPAWLDPQVQGVGDGP